MLSPQHIVNPLLERETVRERSRAGCRMLSTRYKLSWFHADFCPAPGPSHPGCFLYLTLCRVRLKHRNNDTLHPFGVLSFDPS